MPFFFLNKKKKKKKYYLSIYSAHVPGHYFFLIFFHLQHLISHQVSWILPPWHLSNLFSPPHHLSKQTQPSPTCIIAPAAKPRPPDLSYTLIPGCSQLHFQSANLFISLLWLKPYADAASSNNKIQMTWDGNQDFHDLSPVNFSSLISS